jgi:hypothetical protein
MNEAQDPLERELAALRPQEATRELRQRIADHRAMVLASRSRARRWSLAVASGLAAACVAAAVFLVWPSHQRVVPVGRVVETVPPPPAVEPDKSEPTLLAYQRALARSPEDLDALLARDSVVASEHKPDHARISAFTRSDAELHSLLGDY